MKFFLLGFVDSTTDLNHNEVGDMCRKTPNDDLTARQAQEVGETCWLGHLWRWPQGQKLLGSFILDEVTYYRRLVLMYQVEEGGVAEA